jgi:hypothetical protein
MGKTRRQLLGRTGSIAGATILLAGCSGSGGEGGSGDGGGGGTPTPSCEICGTYQAEDATIEAGTGTADGRNSDGGFVEFNPNAYENRGGEGTTGALIQWTLEDVARAGEYEAEIQYALDVDNNGVAGDTMTLSLSVNGEEQVDQISFEDTGDWTAWEPKSVTIELEEGTNEVTLKHDEADTGGLNVDFLRIVGYAG